MSKPLLHPRHAAVLLSLLSTGTLCTGSPMCAFSPAEWSVSLSNTHLYTPVMRLTDYVMEQTIDPHSPQQITPAQTTVAHSLLRCYDPAEPILATAYQQLAQRYNSLLAEWHALRTPYHNEVVRPYLRQRLPHLLRALRLLEAIPPMPA